MTKGAKTSELWLLVGAVLLVVFGDRVGANIPADLQETIVQAAMVYLLGRTGVKSVGEWSRKTVNVEYKEKTDA